MESSVQNRNEREQGNMFPVERFHDDGPVFSSRIVLFAL